MNFTQIDLVTEDVMLLDTGETLFVWIGLDSNKAEKDAVLMTAKDSPTLFDLRCDVREALIQWLAEEMPEAIVRQRIASPEPLRVESSGAEVGSPGGQAMG